MDMRIDVTVPMNLPVPQQLEHIRRVEAMGFDGAGLIDHMEFGRDVYSVLSMAAAQTSRISLFPCVSNPVTRHPWVLANIAHAIDEVAPGRFRLVIGAGDTAVMHVGKKPARVAEMRSAVSDIRKLLSGEAVSFIDGVEERISGIQPPAPSVVIAAGGPRMTEVAGEVGDEAFLLTGFSQRVLAAVHNDLQTGASRSGRTLDGFKLTHYTVVRIDDDEDAAAEFMSQRLFGWIKQGFFKAALAELGINPDLQERPEDIAAPDMARLVEEASLVGPAAKIGERLQSVAGLDRMVCVISGPQGPGVALETFAREILPRVR